MNIFYSPKFERDFRKLPHDVQLRAEPVLTLLEHDPFSPKLKTHKLHGDLKKYWACSVDYSHRILFQFVPEQNGIMLRGVGNHSIYE